MPSEAEFSAAVQPYRRELLVHCYRMLGAHHDAQDALQETLIRAWRGYDRFEGRSSLRSWLYRIATNVCLTESDRRARRVLPSELGTPVTDGSTELADRRYEVTWIGPLPDHPDDPADEVQRKETTRLAFIAALQRLPAKQRAVLLLRDVVGLSATEVAEQLEMTTAAVNSALQRARGHAGERPGVEAIEMTTDVDRDLLERYVDAFHRGDTGALSALLRRDVALEMPPVPTWFAGHAAVMSFFANRALHGRARRVVPLAANGCPAMATFVAREDGTYVAHNIQVLESADGLVQHIYAFVDPDLFPVFGLPTELPE